MFSKATVLRTSQLDPSDAERFTDLLYEMGNELLGKKRYNDAVKWLERAYDLLTGQDVEKLSCDAEDLRISIAHSLVKALLGLQCEDARSKAWNLINLLQDEHGNKLVILLLRLELISTNREFEAMDYHECLRRIIHTVHLTDSNLRTILYHIHKLKREDSTLACQALDDLLCVRLLDTEKEKWVEKAFITRIWTSTSASNCRDILGSLRGFLELVTISRPKHLVMTASATHAAHVLLWKQIEAAFGQQQYDVAASWCRLALLPVFENCGWLNVAKIERKLLLCALRKHDLSSARELYLHMSDASKGAPMTKYLMYKVALQSEDDALGEHRETQRPRASK